MKNVPKTLKNTIKTTKNAKNALKNKKDSLIIMVCIFKQQNPLKSNT